MCLDFEAQRVRALHYRLMLCGLSWSPPPAPLTFSRIVSVISWQHTMLPHALVFGIVVTSSPTLTMALVFLQEEDSPGRKDAQNQHVSPNLPPAGGPRQRRGKPSDSGASAQRRKAAPRATVMRHVQELISGQGKRLDQMTAEERGTLLATAFGPRDSSM